jgi:hypothetical protein
VSSKDNDDVLRAPRDRGEARVDMEAIDAVSWKESAEPDFLSGLLAAKTVLARCTPDRQCRGDADFGRICATLDSFHGASTETALASCPSRISCTSGDFCWEALDWKAEAEAALINGFESATTALSK